MTSNGAWVDWVLYIVEQVRLSAHRTLALVTDLTAVESTIKATVRETTGTANADLVGTSMGQPCARVRDVVAACGVSRPTATKWLRALVDGGSLTAHRVGREVLYVNVAMLDLLAGASGSATEIHRTETYARSHPSGTMTW